MYLDIVYAYKRTKVSHIYFSPGVIHVYPSIIITLISSELGIVLTGDK